jgi:hypothetical protein
VALSSYGKSSNNVDVTYGYLLDELSILGEQLHARSFTATITDNILARRTYDGDLAWVPQLAFLTTRYSKLVLELSSLLKDLYTVVVRIRNDNILIHAETETMWRVELTFPRTQLAKLAPDLHGTDLSTCPQM